MELPRSPWDTTEAYVINASTFTKYHIQLAVALKIYVKDEGNSLLGDQTVTHVLTDLRQNTEYVDCTNILEQAVVKHADLYQAVQEDDQWWKDEAEELYRRWKNKQASR